MLQLAQTELKPDTGGPEFPGESLVNAMVENQEIERDFVWWSHEKNNAIRMGRWKAVKTSSTDWELYDLSVDRSETRNLAGENPQQLSTMINRWNETRDQFAEDIKE